MHVRGCVAGLYRRRVAACWPVPLSLSRGGVHLSALLILAVPYVPLQLYANYLGQHLRYQHSVSPGPAHAYQPGPQQVLLPGALSGAGAMMLPGVSPMTPMTSVMGYGQGYAQGYGQGYGHVSQYPVQVPVQSMHGYGSPMLGLQGYASYPGWAQALAQAQGVAGGVPQGVGTHGVAAAASRGSSYAAAGLPVLRGQMPGLPGAFPAMATAAPVFFHQLMSGLPSVIPR